MSNRKTEVFVTREIFPPFSSGRSDYHFRVRPHEEAFVEVSYMENGEVVASINLDAAACDQIAASILLCAREVLSEQPK